MTIKSQHPMKLDTAESAFFQRQLEHVKTGAYDVKYKELVAMNTFPISTEAPSGAKEITYRSYSMVGIAKIIADYAHDFPRVDVHGEEKSAKVRGIGDSYGYSIEEIRGSIMAGTNLEQRKANAARRASDEFVDNIAWNGDSDYDLQGFIDYPGITSYTVPADGTGASKLWSTKTPDQINRDITGMVNAIITPTKKREQPDTLLLPTEQYNYISSTRMTGGDSTTIMTFILNNNPFIKRIELVTEMVGAGTGSTDRMMLYKNDPNNITLEIPQPFEQFDPIQTGMEFEVICHQKTGGIIIYYPLSVCYGDGI